jgi:hypothetical protein
LPRRKLKSSVNLKLSSQLKKLNARESLLQSGKQKRRKDKLRNLSVLKKKILKLKRERLQCTRTLRLLLKLVFNHFPRSTRLVTHYPIHIMKET